MVIFLFLFLLILFSVCLENFQAGFIVSGIVSVVVAWISSLQNKVEALQQKVLELTNICEEVLGNKVQRKSRRKIAEDAMEVVNQADVKEEIVPLAKKAVAAKVNYNAVKEKAAAKMEAVVEEDKKAVAVVIPAKVKLNKKATIVENKQTEIKVSARGRSPIVWIAGFAAVLGAFYLVKYLVLHGFLGPVVRLTLLAFAGALSVICGAKLFNKKDFADHERIAQVLMGVGVTALYFCSYALSKLYFFAPEYVSFILMCAVSVLAIILTLKFNGMPIAILSMLGGLLTPMLVSGISLHMPFFSAYMLVFVGAFLYMAAALCSPLLFVLALVAGYVWAFVRLVCFDFYMYDSIWTMLLIGGIAVMTNCFSKRFDKQQSMGLTVVSLVLSGVFAIACLIKADFGILEWGICAVMLATTIVLALIDEQKYLVLGFWTAFFLLLLMLFSMHNTAKDMIVYGIIGAVALLPIYCGILLRFPHINYSLYNAVLMPLFWGGSYILFGKGDALSLYGVLGGVLCMLPVLGGKLKDKTTMNCAGILVLTAAVMITFGLCLVLDTEVFVIMAAIEVLIFSAAMRTSINYLSYGLSVAIVWFLYMVAKAVICMFYLLLPVGGDFIKFYASDLTLNVFVSYGIIPFICFAGAWLLQKNKNWRLILKVMAYVIAVCTLFMWKIVMKMTGFVYQINIIDYALITGALFVALLLIGNKIESVKILGRLLLGCRLIAIMSIILISFYGSSELAYGGVTFVLGLPMLLLIWGIYKQKDIAQIATYTLVAYSFVLMTSWLNISSFGKVDFGYFYTLSGGMLFTYSCGWFVLGVIWMVFAFYNKILIKPAFGMIYFVIAKVFLYDVAALDDFWRIVSLFALAGALLAVSHFYTKCFKEA